MVARIIQEAVRIVLGVRFSTIPVVALLLALGCGHFLPFPSAAFYTTLLQKIQKIQKPQFSGALRPLLSEVLDTTPRQKIQ